MNLLCYLSSDVYPQNYEETLLFFTYFFAKEYLFMINLAYDII